MGRCVFRSGLSSHFPRLVSANLAVLYWLWFCLGMGWCWGHKQREMGLVRRTEDTRQHSWIYLPKKTHYFLLLCQSWFRGTVEMRSCSPFINASHLTGWVPWRESWPISGNSGGRTKALRQRSRWWVGSLLVVKGESDPLENNLCLKAWVDQAAVRCGNQVRCGYTCHIEKKPCASGR